MKWIRWGFVLVYALLIVLAVAYLEYSINCYPVHSEFSGLPLIVLGLPWSVAIPRLIGTDDPSFIARWLPLVGGILLNGFILRLPGGMIAQAIERGSHQ
jgi:hypothetical protein